MSLCGNSSLSDLQQAFGAPAIPASIPALMPEFGSVYTPVSSASDAHCGSAKATVNQHPAAMGPSPMTMRLSDWPIRAGFVTCSRHLELHQPLPLGLHPLQLLGPRPHQPLEHPHLVVVAARLVHQRPLQLLGPHPRLPLEPVLVLLEVRHYEIL